MFTSGLEVSKFQGASIKTVSGIRGQIKKALAKPEGAFRATFEDKVQLSDIVFLRAWYPVKPKQFYNPVSSLLLENKEWKGMRLTGQVRYENGLLTPNNPDSEYKPIVRKEKRFSKLKIPKSLQAQLPFKSKPKLLKKQSKPSLMTRRAVIREPDEKRIVTLLQQINTIKHDKDAKRKVKDAERKAIYLKKKKGTEESIMKKRKERNQEFYEKSGKMASSGKNKKY